MRVKRVGRCLLWSALLALAVGLVALNSCTAPLRIDPLLQASRPPVVDERLALARRFAPWVFHSSHPTRGRQDIPAPVDFDGDLNGENNWENMPRYELLPTLYYACLETDTHWYLTYHIFHPRDWTLFDLGVHLTHEGDGENLQVVVDRQRDRPVLLYTQAHYRGGVYADAEDGFGSARESLRGPLVRVDGRGHLDPDGQHAAVYVEYGGHGIYGAADHRDVIRLSRDRPAQFDASGWILRPARQDEEVGEPSLGLSGPLPYRLESTTARLWPLLKKGELTGEGRLLDGTVPYRDDRVAVELPRYHEANRFSGPLGPDRGISPFAIDFGFRAGKLGALFFDPARRYAESLKLPGPWSSDYIDYPFETD